jgi:hypothetical protein
MWVGETLTPLLAFFVARWPFLQLKRSGTAHERPCPSSRVNRYLRAAPGAGPGRIDIRTFPTETDPLMSVAPLAHASVRNVT